MIKKPSFFTKAQLHFTRVSYQIMRGAAVYHYGLAGLMAVGAGAGAIVGVPVEVLGACAGGAASSGFVGAMLQYHYGRRFKKERDETQARIDLYEIQQVLTPASDKPAVPARKGLKNIFARGRDKAAEPPALPAPAPLVIEPKPPEA